jgi:hypothetical protein
MKIIQKLFMMLSFVSVLNAASSEDLTAENLRAIPQIKLTAEDIVKLLNGSRVSCWSLFDTSLPLNRRHIIREAVEVSISADFEESWLFYVTEKSGQQVLILKKLINTFMGDDMLLISTPITDDFAGNPWVSATTIDGDISDVAAANLTKLFEPFMRKE